MIKLQYNHGFFDGKADKEKGRINRQYIREGKIFCLPIKNKEYCKGYKQGYNNHE